MRVLAITIVLLALALPVAAHAGGDSFTPFQMLTPNLQSQIPMPARR